MSANQVKGDLLLFLLLFQVTEHCLEIILFLNFLRLRGNVINTGRALFHLLVYRLGTEINDISTGGRVIEGWCRYSGIRICTKRILRECNLLFLATLFERRVKERFSRHV